MAMAYFKWAGCNSDTSFGVLIAGFAADGLQAGLGLTSGAGNFQVSMVLVLTRMLASTRH
jgi:hypothetical protein